MQLEYIPSFSSKLTVILSLAMPEVVLELASLITLYLLPMAVFVIGDLFVRYVLGVLLLSRSSLCTYDSLYRLLSAQKVIYLSSLNE